MKDYIVKNKKQVILLSVILVLVIVESVLLISRMRNKNSGDGKVFATYNGGVIYESEVEDYLRKLENTFNQKLNLNGMNQDDKELVAKEIVNTKIVLEKAKKSGITKTKKFKDRIKDEEEAILREMFIQSLVEKQITDEAIKTEYNRLLELVKGKKEYKIKQIVVKNKEDINKVINALRTKTFEEVAEEYSIDDTRKTGGELGYVLEGQLLTEFENVVKTQPLNKLSAPFETKIGWHILIKEDERNAEVPEFDKVKDIIKTSLTTSFIRNYSLDNLKDMNVELK